MKDINANANAAADRRWYLEQAQISTRLAAEARSPAEARKHTEVAAWHRAEAARLRD